MSPDAADGATRGMSLDAADGATHGMSFDAADVAICLADDIAADVRGAPLTVPIVQSSLFAFPDFASLLAGLAAEREYHVYSRGRNPTVAAVEHKLALLEQGEACTCFGSGMGAVSAVMLGLLDAGDHMLFVNNTYGPTLQLARHLRRFGIEHDVLPHADADDVTGALRHNTRLLWLESPGTMLFRTLDVARIAAVARAAGVTTCIDNSWATPLLQKPLAAGIDVVVHSGSKYLGGHSDVMAGAVITDHVRMEQVFQRAYMLNGALLSPHDAWLLMRGLRTLPVRLQQQQQDALRVAEFLRGQPAVQHVYHPAFEPAGQRARSGLAGWSGLFSFALRDAGFAEVRTFIDALRRFRIGVSWGGVESLVISPNRGDNAADLDAHGIPPGLVRLSIGLEGAGVLIEDLDRALRIVS